MTTTDDTARRSRTPTLQEQAAAVVIPQAAGYVGHRTITMGQRTGLLQALADTDAPLSPQALAQQLEFDPFYTAVWCQAALAAGVLEADDGRYRLAPHMDTLLLDTESPAYAGAQFTLLEQPEVFDWFEEHLDDGRRAWWDDAGAQFIAEVAASGKPFYHRLVPSGLAQIDGLADRLSHECRILDTACGAGNGLIRIARTYPDATVVGADGDAHSLRVARERVDEAGVGDRVTLMHTPLEELDTDEEFALVTNNISMHECRDADAVTANIREALEDGGWFVISDVPFPDSMEGLRSPAGRMMSGVQFWEAQIDDQLQPREVYDDLLADHGFSDIGSFELAPVHAVTHGRA